MEYKPALPETNDNISNEHPLKDFFILLMGLVALMGLIFFLLGLAIDFFVLRISPEKESEWFRASPFSAQIKASIAGQSEFEPLIFDDFERLKQCAHVNVPISVYISESDLINAVAIPGGDIIVFKGLIDKVASENGLVFVLAHELAHFRNRDHLRSMGRGVVLIGLVGFFSGGNTSLINLVGSMMGFNQAQFSQAAELAADEEALSILNCFYGHIGGFDEFFLAMLNESDSAIHRINRHFASHPQTEARIAALKKRAEKAHYAKKKTKAPLNLLHLPENH